MPPEDIEVSRCALDKNPNIPSEVTTISIRTEAVRYVFINIGALFQFWCNHVAVTSFPTSRTPPIIAIGITAPENIDYRTYSTEETQGNAQTSYNKQIIVEPNCQNLIIAHVPSTSRATAPTQAWESYRLAINNNDVAGNRDIAYKKPLHEDRILRFMNNRGQNISNITLNQIDTKQIQGAFNQIPFYPILETMPLTQEDKLVNLELNSNAGAQNVIFFKELTKSI